MAVEYDPAIINKVFEVTEPVEVKGDKIRRYCAALGETNPIYTDAAAAKKAQLPINPITGQDAEGIVGKLVNAPANIVQQAKNIYE